MDEVDDRTAAPFVEVRAEHMPLRWFAQRITLCWSMIAASSATWSTTTATTASSSASSTGTTSRPADHRAFLAARCAETTAHRGRWSLVVAHVAVCGHLWVGARRQRPNAVGR